MIYLDNCSTTRIEKSAAATMMKIMEEDFGNPSSLHRLGINAENILKETRSLLSRLLKVKDKELYFTSGGTESNNIALHGLLEANKRKGNHIISTNIEHPSIKNQLLKYKEKGYDITFVEVNNIGEIKVDDILNAMRSDTSVISLFHVNNEIGSINNIEEIVKEVKKRDDKIFFHVDGVQAFGKIDINLNTLGCHTYSISGHKVHGPKGVGVLYVKDNIKIPPLIQGGGQEFSMRSGTENVPAIGGLGAAVKCIISDLDANYNHITELNRYLRELILKTDDVTINTPKSGSPYILNVSIKDIRAEVLLHYLEEEYIYISTTSACNSKGVKDSYVLKALGLGEEDIEGTIRICLSRHTSREEIDIFYKCFVKYVDEIRKIMKR